MGNTVCTLGSVPALPYYVSSKADYGLFPQSDLGVVFFVTDFSQLLITAPAFVMATATNVSSGMGHAPRLLITVPFLGVVSVGWRGLSSQGEEDGNATEY